MSKEEKLAQAYQLLCNVQDLVEEAGEFWLMRQVDDLRTELNRIRFSRPIDGDDESEG